MCINPVHKVLRSLTASPLQSLCDTSFPRFEQNQPGQGKELERIPSGTSQHAHRVSFQGKEKADLETQRVVPGGYTCGIVCLMLLGRASCTLPPSHHVSVGGMGSADVWREGKECIEACLSLLGGLEHLASLLRVGFGCKQKADLSAERGIFGVWCALAFT